MKLIKKIIVMVSIGLSFQPYVPLYSAAIEEAVIEDIDSAVSRGLKEGLGSALRGSEEEIAAQTKAVSEQISQQMKELIENGASEDVIKELAGKSAQDIGKQIAEKMAAGVEGEEAVTFSKAAEELVTADKIGGSIRGAAEAAGVPDDEITNLEVAIQKVGQEESSTVIKGPGEGAGAAQSPATEVAAEQLKDMPQETAAVEDAASAARSAAGGPEAKAAAPETAAITKTPAVNTPGVGLRVVRAAYDATGIPAEQQAARAAVDAATGEVDARTVFVDAVRKGDLIRPAGEDGISELSLRNYGDEAIKTKPNATIVDAKYGNGEFTLTTKEGETIRVPRKGVLESLNDPDSLGANSFKVDEEGNVRLRFREDDPIFGFDSVEPEGVLFRKFPVKEKTFSFKDLSNKDELGAAQELKTEVEARDASVNSTLGKTKITLSTAAKWVYAKGTSLISMIFHGLMQAIIFTVPNILEQARVQAAQIAEQWLSLTSAQSFGNLRVQIPAFLIPRAAPTSGVFLYLAVPQNTPSNKANNFDDPTLLSGMYFVSMSDQYTPWGSYYIPQASTLVNINTGFQFNADGSSPSSQAFIALMKDKGASTTPSAGSGPVIMYLDNVLGKGIGSETSGETHMSSWRDWLPIGNVETASTTAASSPALAFLFDDIKNPSSPQESLPPAVFNTALTQFLKPGYVGQGPCNFDSHNSQSAFNTCMKSGMNALQVSQLTGLGNVSLLLSDLANESLKFSTSSAGVLQLSPVLTKALQDFMAARKDLFNSILAAGQVHKGEANMQVANQRNSLLLPKLAALDDADKNLAENLSTTAGGELVGVSPEVFVHAVGMYVYETTQTPIAQFMIQHSPLAAITSASTGSKTVDASDSILKDYVVFLDDANNVVPLYTAGISQQGTLEYFNNTSITYMVSLVSGRTYKLGSDASLTPLVQQGGTVTQMATAVWSNLFDSSNGIYTTMDKNSGGHTSKALAAQITAMASYAAALIANGPYMKSGYMITKVDLVSQLDPSTENLQVAEQNAFNAAVTFLTPAANTNLKTIYPTGTDLSTVGGITIKNNLTMAQKQSLAGSDGGGITLYKVAGALGTAADGTLIDDYVLPLAVSQLQNPVIMPLSVLAFPTESSGINALVSVVTGKVFTTDYVEQPASWLVQVPLVQQGSRRYTSSQSPTAAQLKSGQGILTVSLPIATAFMPTAVNPYNYVPTNPATALAMEQARSNVQSAITAYQNTRSAATQAGLKNAISVMDGFNKNIANGTIAITPRQTHTIPLAGDLLIMGDYYWGTYSGYSICGASSSSSSQASTAAAVWPTDQACPNSPPLGITVNGNLQYVPLFDALPVTVAKEIATSFGQWFNNMLQQNQATASFEVGPFNYTNVGSNDLYLMANLGDIQHRFFLYQAAPGFDSKDILICGELKNTGSLPSQVSLDDFDVNTIGQSFTQLANPALIDLKNGYVFMPKQPASGCSGSVLCNLSVAKMYDIPDVVTQLLANNNMTMAQLESKNPSLAQRLQLATYQFEVSLQTMLTQNYFAGKQLLLSPNAISSYIYAVGTAPSTAGAGNTTDDYVDQIQNLYENASDYWVCYDSINGVPVQKPISSSTVYMVSLVTGDKYSASSALSGGSVSGAAVVQKLTNIPSFLMSGRLETLSNNYAAQAAKQAFMQPAVDLKLPVSFFSSLTRVPSTQFDNLYQAEGQYVLKIEAPTLEVNNNVISLAAQSPITYFVFNQVGATKDTGAGYYYTPPAEQAPSASSSLSVSAAMVEPSSKLAGFNLQSMRAHYGVTVNQDGTQTLVLPMTSQPLPMAGNDTNLKAGQTGTYMKYLASIVPQGSTAEKDYYYQNTIAENFLMRRVITTSLSAFAKKTMQPLISSMTTDYYIDLVSGDEFNTDGTPRLKQVVVAYTTVPSSNASMLSNASYAPGPLNLTNPLFVWGEMDLTTGLPAYHALFQQFDDNGYTEYAPQSNGMSYDVQIGGNMARYSYQVSANGVVSILNTPITNNQPGLQAVLGTPTTAGTDMKTALQSSGGSIISINTTFTDTSQMYQTVSLPNVYTFVPASTGLPFVFTQVIPGVTTAASAQVNATNNASFISQNQITSFVQGIPFVATLTGQASAAEGQGNMVGAPTKLGGKSFHICGLLSPEGGLLSVVSYHPGANSGQTTSATTATQTTAGTATTTEPSCASNSSSCTLPGMYYFIANGNDSVDASAWLKPQQGSTYTQNYQILEPNQDPTIKSFSNSAPATLYGGTFRYALKPIADESSAPSSSSKPLSGSVPSTSSSAPAPVPSTAPDSWAASVLYVALMPQTISGSSSENVPVNSEGSLIYNFVYSSVSTDDLPIYNNNVQVVTTENGTTVLAGPIPSGLVGQQVQKNPNASGVGYVSTYKGGTSPSSLAFSSGVGYVSNYSGGMFPLSSLFYQVTGNEEIQIPGAASTQSSNASSTTGSTIKAPFNALAPTYAASTSNSKSDSTPAQAPFVAPGSLIDMNTGVVYVPQSGTYYPVDTPAPQGSLAFINQMLTVIAPSPITSGSTTSKTPAQK